MNGAVVGINSSIRTAADSSAGGESGSIGLGFAIPIDEVMPIVEQMVDGETPTHARLGVERRRRHRATAAAGVADGRPGRASVTAGSAAAQAGLEAGRRRSPRSTTSLITGADSLVATIRSYRPGDEVEVTWERDGETQTRADASTLDSDVRLDRVRPPGVARQRAAAGPGPRPRPGRRTRRPRRRRRTPGTGRSRGRTSGRG